MNANRLDFKNLTLGYGSHAAVHHLNGSVARGSLTAVVGANGSGKSTLMKGIAGILKPISGTCELHFDRLGYLPQHSEIDRFFPARVIDLVSLGFWQKRGLFGRLTRGDRDDLSNCLAEVGLHGFENRPLDSLSGGQMQRALFARTMLQDADLILLDEPFNAVDEPTIRHLMDVIEAWVSEGRTVLCVLHDHALVRSHFPETLLMARKPVAWGPTSEVLTEHNLSRARIFQEAWDDNAGWCEDDTESQVHSQGHDDTAHSHRTTAHV
ncbi:MULTISPECIES: zinc ABC transporter ATP-binding protein AztA [unclassified Rhizobium]|uniref:zinc ABC transporter ATP-binding protein AztA n=1 Tax=unclassified Rhizobium TaxID=2613769 RepID=UPI00104DCF8B|nr:MULTISPECIES: zinc ABC transporter ATP-binding protein AztA [unclassified Rhizobium]MBB3399340.1 zinc/manganese transport system ATP-binding protein [Rhizobium sp. BK060]MBB4166621.1 zinc/manganese transport system ATP-binding protein [Rhizobium sp. BK538]TCM67631.1 zinc/manganese transport system ATP-binding protein [Rhizobium sp. BK068]